MYSIHNSSLPSFSAIAKEILRDLDHHINIPPTTCPGLEDHETLDPEKLMDTRTRFLLWTGNLGVMHKAEDPRALDRRLLDAPEVAGRVRDILGDLQDLLSQSGRPCGCDASQRSPAETTNPMDDEDAMMMQLLGLQTSKKCTTSWLAASLDDTLRRLFHLSSLITKSSTRDKFVRAQVKCRLGTYEYYDIQHVREKVKHASGRADESLVTRLGKANTSRRQFIAYAHEHNAELSHLDPDDDQESGQRHAKHGLSDKNSIGHSVLRSEITKQSAVPTKASTVGFVDPNAFDYGLDDARSCTTVATSIVDGQAFSGLKVPELAQYAKPGEHFVCPLCQTVQRFNGQVAWRRHIFSDIRAYICTSTKCGMLMFSSFNAWRSHEMDHRREWLCPHCNLVHHDKLKARKHMTQHYSNSDDHHQVDLLLQTSSRLPEYLSADGCPFCDWSATLRKRNLTSKEHDLTVPSRRFMKHLGRHLEEIALFVVPQPEEDQFDSDDIGSNAVHAAQGEYSATNSTLSSFDSKKPSVASTQSQNSLGDVHEESNRGLCPYPTCGGRFRDLKAHMLTHQIERSEKCPVPSCEYHTKGFVRTYDRRRHTLTHYKGTMMCGFCSSFVPPAEKSFHRVDVFKRHLSSSHGVEQIPPSARRRAKAEGLSDDISHTGAGDGSKCSNCGNAFSSAQKFYEHLDDCVLSIIESQLHNNPTTASSAAHDSYKVDENAKECEDSDFQSGASFTAQLVGDPDPVAKAYPASSPRFKEALQSVRESVERIMTRGPHGDDMKAGFASPDPEEHGERAASPNCCHNCGRSETPEWRRGPDGPRTLCNSCGLKYAKLVRKLNNASKDQDGHQHGSSDDARPHSLQDYQSRLLALDDLNRKRYILQRGEVDSTSSRPNWSPNHLGHSGTTPPSAEQSPPLDERPSHDNRLPAPHQSLVNERLQAANALRSLSLPSASVEQPMFRSGSPLAPRQPTRKEFASHRRISNSQITSQQNLDFHVTAIIAQQANAMRSQESGDEVVPATTSNIPNDLSNYQTPSQNEATIFVTPADNEHGQAMNIMQQERDAAAQLAVQENPSHLMTHRPQTISPKESMLDFNYEQYVDNAALLSNLKDDSSFQFPPVETPSRNDVNNNVTAWLGPDSQTVKFDWYSPYDQIEQTPLEQQYGKGLERARYEHDERAWPSRRDYAPESTPFTHDSPFPDDKQARDAQQITEFKDLLQSNDLSPALAERLPSVKRLLETSEANKSRLRTERQLGKTPLTSDARSYRSQLLRRKTNEDSGS